MSGPPPIVKRTLVTCSNPSCERYGHPGNKAPLKCAKCKYAVSPIDPIDSALLANLTNLNPCIGRRDIATRYLPSLSLPPLIIVYVGANNMRNCFQDCQRRHWRQHKEFCNVWAQ